MFTVALKQDSYELFRYFLRSNYPLFKNLDDDQTDGMISQYASKKGFSRPLDYADHLFSLTFKDMLREIKLMIAELSPRQFFQFDPHFKALTRIILEENAWGEDIFEFKKDLLPTKLQSQPETINVLEVETATGEGIYSVLNRFRPVLQKALKFNLLALESDEILLDRALKNHFDENQIKGVSDQDKTLNFEEVETGIYQFTSDYVKMIKFAALDILREDLSLIRDDKYQLILCGNLPYLYPKPVVKKIIEKIIPYLKLEGYLFIDFPDNRFPEFDGLDIVKIDGVSMYKRNRKAFKSRIDEVIERTHDSIENLVTFSNYYVSRRQPDRAINELEKVTQKRWKSPVLFHLLGDLYLMKSQKNDALSRYSKAVMASKEFIPSYFNIILLNLINGSLSEASAVNERLQGKLRTSDFESCSFDKFFNIDSAAIIDYAGQLVEAIRHEDSLSLESIILEAMRTQRNENIIPIQTGIFKSLLAKRSGDLQEPTQYKQKAQVMFLDNFSHADFSKLIKERSNAERERREKSGETLPPTEKPAHEDNISCSYEQSEPEPGEFRPMGAMPRSMSTPPRKPSIHLDMEKPSLSAMANQPSLSKEQASVTSSQRPMPARAVNIEPQAATNKINESQECSCVLNLNQNFIRDTEKLLDLGDYDGIISLIDSSAKGSDRNSRQLYRILYKFCAKSMKLSHLQDRLQKVIPLLQELAQDTD